MKRKQLNNRLMTENKASNKIAGAIRQISPFYISKNKKNSTQNYIKTVSNKINISYSLQDREKQTPYFNNRKLTAQNVADIRQNEQHLSYQQLANRYHVSKTTINNVINNKYYIGQSPSG